MSTVFGYGCHIGPAQLARAIEGLDRRQTIWINLRHISEEALDRVIGEIVARYHRFTLPHRWGSARRVGADGTHRALSENNLLSERHVRYGDYGGIAYSHVAGTSIARFSHVISCGALEGSSILDPFFAPGAPGSCRTPSTATRTGRARPSSFWPTSRAPDSTPASAAGRSSSGAAPTRTAGTRTSTRSSPGRWTGT